MALKQRVTTIKRMQSLAGLLKESFADRIEKQKGEGDMEEGFKDRIKAASAKEKEVTEPELIKLLPIVQKECGKDYTASNMTMNGKGLMFVTPKNLGSGVVGRPLGAVITPGKISNGIVFVGITNGTVDSRGELQGVKDAKKFNANDTENILDHIAVILAQVENYQ